MSVTLEIRTTFIDPRVLFECYTGVSFHLAVCSLGPGPAMILYCHNDGPASDYVLTLSDFLCNCGVDCDIDQYHTNDNITDWDQWWERRINNVIARNGFVLFAVAYCDHLKKCMAESGRIQMSHGFISGLLLSSMIGDRNKTSRIIPVFLDAVNGALLPGVLSQRTSYCANIRVLDTVNGPSSAEILNMPGLESLRSLVFRLTGQVEVEKPMVAPVPQNSREFVSVY